MGLLVLNIKVIISSLFCICRSVLEKKRKTEDTIAMLEGSGKKKKMKKKHKS
jgi:hypothetical protein